ncbi:hypothetical protein [Burkholderia glumae]|uniref:Hydrogenase maturation factor n=1 Tax=Burkholderia glumae TaxID=337 RepID=A0ABY5BDS7_BURGL|nr:hypothetical protein [Burkholderia glumae]KHJ64706.1 hypothetical protein NCPPB3923_01660 [Burkholderia glumae]USS44668.1 hypothetical protein NFI99_23870 [Burkholderia glumae]
MTTAQFHYRGYDVTIDAIEREADGVGPKVVVGMLIVRTRDGEVLFREDPIRMLPAGVVITTQLAIEYRTDESRRRIDSALR